MHSPGFSRPPKRFFAEHGFDAVSINIIAARAGVSKANVFHHFSSKHALYQAVLRNACDATTQQLKHMVAQPGAVAANLTQFAASHLDGILEHDRFARLILREILLDKSREQLDIAQQVFGENFTEPVKILRRGQARSVFRHFPEVDFADDPARYSRSVVDILLRGILAPPSVKNPERADKAGASAPHKE